MSEIPPSGPPTYGSAMRIAEIVDRLHRSPLGVSFPEIRERLGISDRTLSRYVQTLSQAWVDDQGEPLVTVERAEGLSWLRFRRKPLKLQGTAMELMSLFLALDVMRFLQGTVFRRGTEEVLDRLQALLDHSQAHQARLVLKDFRRKFLHWTEAPKDYRDQGAVIGSLVDALVFQKRVVLEYQAPGKPCREHRLAPLTLLMYKRALYLVGRKTEMDETSQLTFAVERIRWVHVQGPGFAYPEDYDPAQRFQHGFGLVQTGKPEQVALLFHAQVAANVASRNWHPSQVVNHRQEGTVELRFFIEIGDEFLAWVLSYGHLVRVLQPSHLVDTIKQRLENAFRQYP